jgi:hypothetical protein
MCNQFGIYEEEFMKNRAVRYGSFRRKRILIPASVAIAVFLSLAFLAHGAREHESPAGAAVPRALAMTPDKSFETLMNEAMAIMHRDMEKAARNGDPDHDFVTMMIPHHQGAIDVVRLVLMYGKDPAIRHLADEIMSAQQSDIQMTQMWLKNHKAPGKGSSE